MFAGDLFVDDSAGTGLVHIAPGHGQTMDAMGCGQRRRTTDELGNKSCRKTAEANEAVIEVLKAPFEEKYEHRPALLAQQVAVIFRAMDQWFVNIDHDGFRDMRLAIDSVNWVPGWGRNRIEGAVQSRPDWCISRQRSWGVPIPAFYDAQGEPILDARIVRNTADLVQEHGSNGEASWPTCGLRSSRTTGKAPRRSANPPTRLTCGLSVVALGTDAAASWVVRVPRPARPTRGRPTITSRVATSIAAGFNRRCSCRSPATALRRTATY